MVEGNRAQAAFEAFATERLQAEAHVPDQQSSDPLEQVMARSLFSTRRFLSLSLGTKRQDGTPFKVHPGFVTRPVPNAFASCRAGIHLCGLNTGLVAQVFRLSLFVLAQPDSFVDIGNAGAEVMASTQAAPALASSGAEPLWIVPRDPARQAFAEDLTHLLLRYVWFHELYHCLNGHVGFLQQFDAAAALTEMPDAALALVERAPAISAPTSDDFQCLEMDADRTALWACFQVQAKEMEPVPSIAQRPLAERQKLTLFAAGLMTTLFEQAARDAAEGGQGTHPLPNARLHNFVRTVASQVTDRLDDMRPLFLSVLTEMHVLRRHFPDLPDIEAFHSDLMAPAFQQPLDAMEDRLDALRVRLGPLAYR